MTASVHFEALVAKHNDLDNMIEHELQRPKPDEALLNKLKKEKLQLKDKINQMKDQ